MKSTLETPLTRVYTRVTDNEQKGRMNTATVTGKIIETRYEVNNLGPAMKLKIEKEGYPGHYRNIWLYCSNEEDYRKKRRKFRTSEYWYFEYARETKQIYHVESSQWHCCLQ